MKKKMCKCGHQKFQHHNDHGECYVSGCKCERYRGVNKVPGVVSKYCQDTPPPDLRPSPEPEPLRW